MQYSILILFLSLAGVSILVFTYIYFTSKRTSELNSGIKNPLKKRFWFFLILVFVLGIFASVTIPRSPYFLFADESPAKVIHVAARQFSFVISDKAIDPNNPVGADSLELHANELVEFRVTSLDVNHGFGIYDTSSRLIAQTQAMPGYVNRLRWKFEEPGEYTILCLEYCGMAHQVMRSSITVK
jgi:cytochrome c oxidase subunit 2